jgi:predicted GH43/DUF377 family glycosyl hydrolase
MERVLIEGVKIFKNDNSVLIYPEKESAQFTIITDSAVFEVADKLATTYTAHINQ